MIDEKLSEQEQVFVRNYTESVGSHLTCVGMRHMPNVTSIRDLPIDKISVHPNLNSYVFLKVIKGSHRVLLENDGLERE